MKHTLHYRRNLFLSLSSFAAILLVGSATIHVNAKVVTPRLNIKKMTLQVGSTKQLKVKKTKKRVIWKSSHNKIAYVTKKGLVKARKKGNVKIYAYLGKKKFVCNVKVIAKAKKQPAKNKQTPSSYITATTQPSLPVSTVVPTNTTDPTSSPTSVPEEDNWNIDKQSGTKEAFKKYFKVDLNTYTEGKDTPLGTIQKIHYDSTVIGETREAYVYTPNGYTTDKTYPVLYLIHGIGCNGSQWVSMQLYAILSNLIVKDNVAPFVAVCPSVIPPADKRTDVTLSPENIQAFTDFDAEFTTDLQPYIQSHYSVSTDRKETALCGLSMGGMEALSLGFSHLDLFDYIGSFSAAPTLDTSLLTTKGSAYIPSLVMLSSGTADNTVGDTPKKYHEVLTQNQVDHIWFQYPRGSHSTEVWQNGLINFVKRIPF